MLLFLHLPRHLVGSRDCRFTRYNPPISIPRTPFVPLTLLPDTSSKNKYDSDQSINLSNQQRCQTATPPPSKPTPTPPSPQANPSSAKSQAALPTRYPPNISHPHTPPPFHPSSPPSFPSSPPPPSPPSPPTLPPSPPTNLHHTRGFMWWRVGTWS